ncbi:hypothetical protein A6A19_06975 [Actinobacillus delphinicola]|uniref:Probable peptidoglycan glycosyltransferase FtsW n=1 Tax=Actinobacillus delphinicola TaxID=51161 RepID=A0A448TUD1_9PAST|nr:putative lipid II flippase FtsW [Actinobacillus delphinicola]MDG6897725.1 hypothetical protein [Actinobacillus delphinicola]VEJ09607.1 cell division protein FtsW [Actinobacillus delphinicola]
MNMLRNFYRKYEKWFQITPPDASYDRGLVLLFIFFLLLGLVAVFSASVLDPAYLAMKPAQKLTHHPDMFRFLKSDTKNVILAFILFCIVLCIPMKTWKKKLNAPLFVLTLGMLILLALGIGHKINGATRWIPLGIMNFQPAELSKLVLICFLASYIARRYEEVRTKKLSLAKPAAVVLLFGVLLLRQPDTGTAAVLAMIMLAMFIMAGVKKKQILVTVAILGVVFTATILMNPYKLARVSNFTNPFSDPYGKGYQLSNSLIAFGRGGIFGEGLGNSIQKWAYLPEPHTDFIMAVWGEELGLVGILFMISLLCILIWKALKISKDALELENRFGGFFACGIATLIFCQGFVNLGAALGLLPTKGLTFPLISYGGSSLLIMATAIAVLLRIDYENRQQRLQNKEEQGQQDYATA